MLKITTTEKGFCWILADVHLSINSNNPINTHFLNFINTQAANADAVFILGDLFEVWTGDDIGIDAYQIEVAALKKLTDSGTPVFLLFGNRDFLMRDLFVQESGVQILPDINLIQLFGEDYLMLHGDTLCTDDSDYQRMRKILRNQFIQYFLLKLSKKRRQKIADAMRQKSKQQTKKKQQSIMDVNREAVEHLFQSFPQISHLIHGHTHRPAHHQLIVNGKARHRWVLGDWRPEAKLIKISASGPELIDW